MFSGPIGFTQTPPPQQWASITHSWWPSVWTHAHCRVVLETLPSALYKVRLDEGSLVMAHIADRIDRNFVRLLIGDRVRVELSPVDVGRGRIVQKL